DPLPRLPRPAARRARLRGGWGPGDDALRDAWHPPGRISGGGSDLQERVGGRDEYLPSREGADRGGVVAGRYSRAAPADGCSSFDSALFILIEWMVGLITTC